MYVDSVAVYGDKVGSDYTGGEASDAVVASTVGGACFDAQVFAVKVVDDSVERDDVAGLSVSDAAAAAVGGGDGSEHNGSEGGFVAALLD